MTDLEQQVVEALRTIRFPAGDGGFALAPMDDEHLKRIAFRVAAAIEGLAERYRQLWESEMATDFAGAEAVKERRIQEAILALRGGA